MRTIVVVGASLAGLESARALRSEGFDGRLIVVGAEPHPPYDRPPLSKGYLDATMDESALALADVADVELRLGVRATRLVPRAKTVELASGPSLAADAVVIATGARARRIPTHLGPAQGVHVLRTLDDASGLRDDLQPGKRLVVVGGGFIGAEVAATAQRLGLAVTIVEVQPRMLLAQLGDTLAGFLAAAHADHGVSILTGRTVAELVGTDRVERVRLDNGTEIPADVVLVGVGAVPAVDWLECSGIGIADGVACDERGRTNVPNVVAVGDCASWRDASGVSVRRQHWTAALRQGSIGARTLLGGSPAEDLPSDVDYVWSDQYDLRLQTAGRPSAAHTATPVNGSMSDGSFTMVFRDGRDVIRAVASVNDPRSFGKWRRRLGNEHTEELVAP